jgi:TRAP-type mannitol/chloroaromatic compound transport system permease small subunit
MATLQPARAGGNREVPPAFYALIRLIDRFNDAIGKVVSLGMLFLVASISYECFSRYLFNSPTIWVFETNYMVNGSAFMLGCAYALLKGAHVRTDIFWDGFSERKKGLVDFCSYLLLFYPTMVLFFAISADDAWFAHQLGERSEQTPWRPLLWPFRAAVPAMALLMMVQGISETLKAWFQLRTGREFEHREKVEV